MAQSNVYLLLCVSSNDDFVIVKKGACNYCTEKKIESTILNAWELTAKEVYNYITRGYITKSYKILCECDSYECIDVNKYKDGYNK